MKGLLVSLADTETSETAFLAAAALLCLTLCPRLKGACAAVGCFAIDQALQWHRMDRDCMARPIHIWLLGAYAFAILGYVSCVTVTKQFICPESDAGCVSQITQHSESKSFTFALAAGLPLCLLAWSGLGIYWFDEVLGSENFTAKQCQLDHGHQSITFAVTCLIALGLEGFFCVVISGLAWQTSQSVARGSAAVMAIADADFLERWGAPKPVLQEDLSRGLSPAQIDTLPCGEGLAPGGESCVICLCPIASNERVRKLPNCSHSFHRCCVDQWLLRSASCPTCKAEVVINDPGSP